MHLLRPTFRAALAAVVLALVAGCGGGSSSQLSFAAGLDTAEFIVLDLSSGRAVTRFGLSDLATNPAYKTTQMVFRRIPGGTVTLGQAAGSPGQQADEAPTPTSVGSFYIGVFEVTQQQWQALAGTTPWTTVTPSSLVAGASALPSSPAFNLSGDQVTAAIASYRSRTASGLVLPSPAQWEHACRAGATTIYAWGDQATQATTHAAVRETGIASPGLRTVGTLTANAFQLHDLHGNVWELTSTGEIRGGSWYDGVVQARAANKVAVESFVRHALVGCRLVLIP